MSTEMDADARPGAGADAGDPLGLATRRLLAPAGIDMRDVERVLGALMRGGADSGDVYFQAQRHEAWTLEDGIVKDGSHSVDRGVGVRAISGEKTGFAYSDEIILPALTEASEAARAIARAGQHGTAKPARTRAVAPLYAPVDPCDTLADTAKIALLHEVDRHARAVDPRVQQVIVSISSSHDVVLVAATDGTLAADVRPLVRFNVAVIVEHDGCREQGNGGFGGRFGLDALAGDPRPFSLAEDAVRQALVNLESAPAPAGEMTVVLGPGWPGILLHEAVGHGLEGDFNRKGISAFSGRVGDKVASELCTVVDDGSIENRRGSLSVDDEGTATGPTVLIEKGVLKGYMQDKHNARLMGVASTGNGRRESFAHLPMPRMTNTFMLNGPHEHDEIIASVKNGLYARNFGGGQVDITSGKFVFSASEAYLIENGRVTRPVRGATLIGDGPDVMPKISMVGNNLALDDGVGTCGKDGQSVPVGVGQPTLRIDGITVGGTA